MCKSLVLSPQILRKTLGAVFFTVTALSANAADYAYRLKALGVKAPVEATPAGLVLSGGRMWMMPDAVLRSYTSSLNLCQGQVFNGVSGWRLPSESEFYGLYDDRVQADYVGKGWFVGTTADPAMFWSSKRHPSSEYMMGYDLVKRARYGVPLTMSVYTVCVHD